MSVLWKRHRCPTFFSLYSVRVVILLQLEIFLHFLVIGVQKALCNPGADLVICDEGHRIKNDQANISKALKKIHTRSVIFLMKSVRDMVLYG